MTPVVCEFMHPDQDLSEIIPVYSIFNELVDEMTVREAMKHEEANEMYIRTKGFGRYRRITSAKWRIYRQNLTYKPKNSGGYLVMQICEG